MSTSPITARAKEKTRNLLTHPALCTSTHTPLLQKSTPNGSPKLEISFKPQPVWVGWKYILSWQLPTWQLQRNPREHGWKLQREQMLSTRDKTSGLSRVSKLPGWLEKFRRYLWGLYCDDPWKGFSGRWTQPSQPCLSRTGAAPRAPAAPSPSAPSHGCTWTTDQDTRGKRNNTKSCEFRYLLFPCPWHFPFFLCKDQLGCACWLILLP